MLTPGESNQSIFAIDPLQLELDQVFLCLKSPAASIVYLYIWSKTVLENKKSVKLSNQMIANSTGLSKSTTQRAIKTIKLNSLLRVNQTSPTATPEYFLLGNQTKENTETKSELMENVVRLVTPSEPKKVQRSPRSISHTKVHRPSFATRRRRKKRLLNSRHK